jgi:hypothetical protein
MDPDGLEDVLDLAKDRSQNQVCLYFPYILVEAQE